MVIYDITNKLLYIPENDDIALIDSDSIYQTAFDEAYEEAWPEGYESGLTVGYEDGQEAAAEDCSTIIRVYAVYDVKSTTEPTFIVNNPDSFQMAYLQDGTIVPFEDMYYTFPSSGIQIVTFIMPSGNTNTQALEDGTFRSCTDLVAFCAPEGSITSVASNVFYNCTSLKSAILPSTVSFFNGLTFRNCTSLETFVYPSLEDYEFIAAVSASMFRDCTSLKSVIFPKCSFRILTEAFRGCTSLETMYIPDSCIDLKTGCFRNCTSLTSISIGKGVTQVGAYLIKGCTNLDSITFRGTTPPTISGTGALPLGGSPSVIYVPEESISAYQEALPGYADIITAISE